MSEGEAEVTYVRYTADDPDYVEIRYQGKVLLVASALLLEDQFALGRYVSQKLGIKPRSVT